MSSVRAFLELVRIPNVFTTPGDVIVGFALGGGSVIVSGENSLAAPFDRAVVLAVLGSALLYSGGMALNDACDAAKDGVERPGRPIPSGRVPRAQAVALSIALLTAGVMATGLSSSHGLIVGLFLCGAIVGYDAVLKSASFAPALMGGCRVLNIALGFAASGADWVAAPLAPFACMWLYVTGVTFFARHEASTNARLRLVIGGTAIIMASLGVALTALYRNASKGASVDLLLLVAPALALSTWHAYWGFRAVRTPSPDVVQRGAAWFVLGVILFDASVLWSMPRPWEAIGVAACLLPAVSLSWFFRVT